MFLIKPTITREWYVVFESTSKRKWHHWWLKEDFHHCYAMTRSEGNLFWLVVHPHQSHTEIDYRLIESFPTVRDYTGEDVLVIEHTTTIDSMQKITQIGIMTCVDVIKRHLGIRAQTVFTPYQLFKHLRNRDGRHI